MLCQFREEAVTAGLRTQHSSSNHCFPRVQGLGHRPAHQGNGDHATQHWPYDPPAEELGILRTDHPHYYKGRLPGESEADFVARIVANLEALILREGPDTIAAFLAEPITGASGVIVPPDGYYTRVQELLRRYDIAFWADEVICGFGHGYTYSGHPLGCAVALKTLEIYERDRIFEHAATVGDYFQRKLRTLAEHPLVGEVRGRGLLAAIELVNDKEQGSAFPPSVATYLQSACADAGLIGRAVAGTAFALCPPLIITVAQVDELVTKLAAGLNATLVKVEREGLKAVA
jgi:4-aminobutyrate--pyruvate transaminase